MSNTINTSQTAYDLGAADHAGGAAPAKPAAGGPAASSQPAASGAEIVSLSTDAAAGTQLLRAAHHADGIDQAAVQRLKTAIQNGTYDVSPGKLARSISAAMRDMA